MKERKKEEQDKEVPDKNGLSRNESSKNESEKKVPDNSGKNSDKSKKVCLLVGMVIILLFLVVAIICFPKNGEEQRENPLFPWNTEEKSEENLMQTDSYIARVFKESDHYVLNLQTNFISEGDSFVFSYDSNKFMLDTSSSLFDDAAMEENLEKTGFTQVSLKLASNHVYQICFIPKEDEEMKLERNLFLE